MQKTSLRPTSPDSSARPKSKNRPSKNKDDWISSFNKTQKSSPREKNPKESVQLKKVISNLRMENNQLKTRIQQGERELEKKDKEVIQILRRIITPQPGFYKSSKNNSKADLQLILTLKKQIGKLQGENKNLKNGLKILKESLNATTIQELKAQIKAYSEECNRLRAMLERAVQKNPYSMSEDMEETREKMEKQYEAIEKLKTENAELVNKINELTEEANKWKLKLKEKKLELSESKDDPIAAKYVKEIVTLKEKIKNMQGMPRDKMEEVLKSKFELKKKEKEREKEIKNLEMVLSKCTRSEYIEEPLSRSTESRRTELLPLIEQEEAKFIGTILRLNLIQSKVPFNDISDVLFKNYDDEEEVSMHEVIRALKRSPAFLNNEDAVKIARFVMEPRYNKEIEYDELREIKLSKLIKVLSTIIGHYNLNIDKEQIQSSLILKLKDKLPLLIEATQSTSGIISLESFKGLITKLNIDLSIEERDYVLLAMYKKRNVEELRLGDFVEQFNSLLGDSKNPLSPGESKWKAVKNIDSGEHATKGSTTKRREEHLSSEVQSERCVENMELEQMVNVVQKCFAEVAEGILVKRLKVEDIFKDKVIIKQIEGEEVQMISPENFISTIQNLGIKEFTTLEKNCLKKALSQDDTEEDFRLEELAKILDDFTDQRLGSSLVKELNFDKLDKVSMVLLLALTEYLFVSKISLYELFGKVIRKELVDLDDFKAEISVISSTDFFDVLNRIQIETEENEDNNLKDIIAVDSRYPNKFSLDKLKAVIEEFATNSELRDRARECYLELLNEKEPLAESKTT